MVSPKDNGGAAELPRVTLEECRSQAQNCIDESRRTQSNPKLSAAWLELAEKWVNMAEALQRAKTTSFIT